MLKKRRVLFLGLLVLAGSACVTPTHASSAHGIVMTYVQASGVGGAKEEVIALHNNSSFDVEITDWCLVNRAAIAFACFAHESAEHVGTTARYVIPGYGDAIVASNEYVAQKALAQDYVTVVYSVTNQSSGSLVGSNDMVSLVDSDGEVQDAKGWTATIAAGKAWARVLQTVSPVEYVATGEPSDWLPPVAWAVPAQSLVQKSIEPIPESEVPVDPEQVPVLPVVTGPKVTPILTEIFANAKGSDAGLEFIELFNPSSSETIDLAGFTLHIGTTTQKSYAFPDAAIIEPLRYRAFYNNELGFSLANTSSTVQIFYQGELVGESVGYSDPQDDMSWSLFDGVWRYTNHASAGALNIIGSSPDDATADDIKLANSQKSCASNQYRNLETGRCKLLAATTSHVACKTGQERNADTGRCRAVATSQAASAPCKAGQERNSETNRCRNIVKMSKVGNGVMGIQTQSGNQPSWYYWAAIGLVVLGVLAYGVWEWRAEVREIAHHIWQRFAKSKS